MTTRLKAPKYILVGGYVTSRNDGDRHYISPLQLASCYNVNPSECILIPGKRLRTLKLAKEQFPDIIELNPRDDGNYRLPAETTDKIEA